MHTRHLSFTGAFAAGVASGTWIAYRRDINAARHRTEANRQFIDSRHRAIEFAEAGNGPAVLLVHGAGGGFDQGLLLGRVLLGDGDRVIAPSRFGYLGTPMPNDASPEAQSEAHLRLLDALRLDRVAVIGVSAGAPSAMQLAIRHGDRCSALVLVVPLAYAPNGRTAIPVRRPVVEAMVASDFAFWLATKLAHSSLVDKLLGTPIEVYRKATRRERRAIDEMLTAMLPISRRIDGIRNDAIVASTLTRFALEDIRTPTLLVGAADCGYGTYDGCVYTAQEIRDARLIAFARGGHLLAGHEEEVRVQIARFLSETRGARQAA